jgi:hypothetical protein
MGFGGLTANFANYANLVGEWGQTPGSMLHIFKLNRTYSSRTTGAQGGWVSGADPGTFGGNAKKLKG